MLAISGYVNFSSERISRISWARKVEVDFQKAKIEDMLYNVLPEPVVARIKRGEVIADAYSDVSVIFCDLVGFSQLSKQVTTGHLIKILQGFFGFADESADRHGIEKVKTIGDAYLAVAGGVICKQGCASAAIAFAKDLNAKMSNFAMQEQLELKLRIGIHTGPVIGGVIGETKKVYDYWGDTMNIASRIQTAATPGQVLVSQATYMEAKRDVAFDTPVVHNLKGIGDVVVYPVL